MLLIRTKIHSNSYHTCTLLSLSAGRKPPPYFASRPANLSLTRVTSLGGVKRLSAWDHLILFKSGQSKIQILHHPICMSSRLQLHLLNSLIRLVSKTDFVSVKASSGNLDRHMCHTQAPDFIRTKTSAILMALIPLDA